MHILPLHSTRCSPVGLLFIPNILCMCVHLVCVVVSPCIAQLYPELPNWFIVIVVAYSKHRMFVAMSCGSIVLFRHNRT